MKVIKILSLLTLSSCLATKLEPIKKGTTTIPSALTGEVVTTGGGTVDLSEETLNPRLLIFAQETCEVCREETIAFKASYAEVQAKNLEIITVLVGSLKEDALAWKSADNWEDSSEVPWIVGYELQPLLFSELCPNSGTPCSLLQLPNKGVVLKRSGILHPEEVIEIIENEEN